MFELFELVNYYFRMLAEKIGELYVLGYDQPYSHIKINKTLSGMHNKIIECRWHEDKWDFMRERVDKTAPNHITTAIGEFIFSVGFWEVTSCKLKN